MGWWGWSNDNSKLGNRALRLDLVCVCMRASVCVLENRRLKTMDQAQDNSNFCLTLSLPLTCSVNQAIL